MVFNLLWLAIGTLLFSVVLAFVLKPKEKNEALDPGKIETPQVEEGKEIMVVFGTEWIRDPNVVWFGDRRIVAVKKKGGKK